MGFEVALDRIHAEVEGMEECFCEYFYSASRSSYYSTVAGTKSPKSSNWLHLVDTGTHHVRSSRRVHFVKNSSDKSEGYFKVGKTSRCVAAC